MSITEKGKKRAKQLADFRSWISIYADLAKRNNKTIVSFIDNASEILNDVYWVMVENYVRPIVHYEDLTTKNVSTNINRFKIISTAELTVMKVSPVKVKKGNLTEEELEEEERYQNATFAYFIAITILKSFNLKLKKESFEYICKYQEDIDKIDPEEIPSIQNEHLWWLACLDTRSTLPILSNSITWRLFNFGLLMLEKKLPNATKTIQKKKGRIGRNSEQGRL